MKNRGLGGSWDGFDEIDISLRKTHAILVTKYPPTRRLRSYLRWLCGAICTTLENRCQALYVL